MSSTERSRIFNRLNGTRCRLQTVLSRFSAVGEQQRRRRRRCTSRSSGWHNRTASLLTSCVRSQCNPETTSLPPPTCGSVPCGLTAALNEPGETLMLRLKQLLSGGGGSTSPQRMSQQTSRHSMSIALLTSHSQSLKVESMILFQSVWLRLSGGGVSRQPTAGIRWTGIRWNRERRKRWTDKIQSQSLEKWMLSLWVLFQNGSH